MNTIEEEDFDYQAYTREMVPDPTKIRRGVAARQQRMMEAASKKQAVRIDKDIFQQFNQLAAEGQSCEQMINQALRQWLAAERQSLSEVQLVQKSTAA